MTGKAWTSADDPRSDEGTVAWTLMSQCPTRGFLDAEQVAGWRRCAL